MDRKLLKHIGLYFVAFVLFIGLTSTFTAKKFIGQPDPIKLDGQSMVQMQVALNDANVSLSYKDSKEELTKENTSKDYKEQKGSEDTSFRENNKEVVYQKGDKGQEITKYQEVLIQLGYLNGNPDGSFGDMMEWAVLEFQKDENLEQTGVLDGATQKALKAVKGTGQQDPEQEKKKQEASTEGNTTEHIVKPGETFSHISAQYDVPIEDILKANNLSETSLIKDGQKLIIPQN